MCRPFTSSPEIGSVATEVAHRLDTQPISFLFPSFVLKTSQGLAIKNTSAVLLALHAFLFCSCYLLLLIGQVLKNKHSN